MQLHKNKVEADGGAESDGALCPATLLDTLDRDLARLEASLDTYAASEHPERYEALRPYLPVLAAYRKTLRSS